MADLDLEKLAALEAAATPGDWAWFGNTKVRSLYIATVKNGRKYVMDFVRWGFGDAQPRFQSAHHVMVPAAELVKYEVDYRKDVADVDHPDAQLIIALRNAAPELFARARQRDEARRLVNEYYLEHQLDAGGDCGCATCGRVRAARGAAVELAKEAAARG